MAFSTEYCIPAGEFARICGTTRDTLRYYHKQGILVPQRNAANGYHYYSYAQVASFYFIATLRGLDCSAADIREYLEISFASPIWDWGYFALVVGK